jgi:phenylpropionate dioxygenase-like ring-hydroxylating dioxygenase large terminal subunit
MDLVSSTLAGSSSNSSSRELPVPRAEDFAAAPASWYYLASLAELSRMPRKLELPNNEVFVGFCGPDGRPVVLGGRCSHMQADLSLGCVKNGRLACPLHGWEYGSDGGGARIPGDPTIPGFARQPVFPTAVRGGHVFFFKRAEARFPMPFFDTATPDSVVAARPFDLWSEVPWYFVGANGFDRQHFENAHDRRLVGEPIVDEPHRFARRSRLELAVEGNSLADRLTRVLAGPRSEMTVTSWCGSLIFVTARFRRAQTFGLMTVRPLKNAGTHARVIVWVRRTGHSLLSTVLNPLNAAIRRQFIKAFLQADLGPLSGTRHHPGRLIPSDKMLADYLVWLHAVHR